MIAPGILLAYAGIAMLLAFLFLAGVVGICWIVRIGRQSNAPKLTVTKNEANSIDLSDGVDEREMDVIRRLIRDRNQAEFEESAKEKVRAVLA